jgi:transposase InsO family protein
MASFPSLYPPVITGIAAMPHPGTRGAPETFDGDGEVLEEFIDRFEGLATGARLTNDDKFKSFTRYCSRPMKRLFESLPAYTAKTWNDFLAQVRVLFPIGANQRLYSKQSLVALVSNSQKQRIYSEGDLMSYYRDFVTIANWLLTNHKISEADRDGYFWFGFHPDDRMQLELQLRVVLPRHDRMNPWPMQDVFEAGKYIFNELAFDQDPTFLQLTGKPMSAVNLQDPEDNFRDLPEMVDLRREKLRRAAAAETMRLRAEPFPSNLPEVQQTVTKTVQFPSHPVNIGNPTEDQEIEELVGKLSTLSFREPQYAIAYAKLSHRFPNLIGQFTSPGHASAAVSQNVSTIPAVPVVPIASSAPMMPSSRPFNGYSAARSCFFCRKLWPDCPGLRWCKVAEAYVNEGKIVNRGGYYYFPNGDQIPRSEQGLKYSVDQILEKGRSHQNVGAGLVCVQPSDDQLSSCYAFVEEDPEDPSSYAFTRSQSRAADKSRESTPNPQGNGTQTQPTILRRPQPAGQGEARPSTQPQTQQGPQPGQYPRAPQYQFRSRVEDEHVSDNVFNKLLEASVKIEGKELLAVSSDMRKRMTDLVKTTKVAPEEQVNRQVPVPDPKTVLSITTKDVPYSLPVREINVTLPNEVEIRGVVDSGSEIVVIRQAILDKIGHPKNPNIRSDMTTANNTASTLKGVAELLPIKVGSITTWVHAHVAQDCPYDLLLGQPWMLPSMAIPEPQDNGEVVIHLRDPRDKNHWLIVPTFEHHARPAPKANLINPTTSNYTVLDDHGLTVLVEPVSMVPPLKSIQNHHAIIPKVPKPFRMMAYLYKKVADKKKPIAAAFPEYAKPKRRFPEDPLLSLPPLSPFPRKEFTPGLRLTQDRWDAIAKKLVDQKFLWPDEIDLAREVVLNNEMNLAWVESERGRFRDDYFDPVIMPTVEHTPWQQKPLPIPPGKYDEIMEILKSKIENGVYEPSTSSYSSRWFTVDKKNGKQRPVHDLQILNSITIRENGDPPVLLAYIERYAKRSIYTVLDLFVGYDNRLIAKVSRPLTAFQTPLGPLQLCTLPMGWTNAIAIFQGDVVFILQDETEVVEPFMDDAPIRGPPTRYELPDGTYETHPQNSGIRRFVWEHLNDVNRILHRIGHSGATVSALKLVFCVPEAEIVGHMCSYEGLFPTNSSVNKIRNWPIPKDLTAVKGFMGLVGTVRRYIKDCAKIAHPLNRLSKKDVPFLWTEDCQESFEHLKSIVSSKPLVRPIDYKISNEVTLAVDSSNIAVGYILSQQDDKDRRWPALYGSITWNDRESRYSQAKIELYGLFRALKACKYHIVGIKNLVVEMDASYVKGMLNNPDIQPNAAINRWIAGIMLFNFTLRHVKAENHKGPDALSRRPFTEGDEVEKEDIDEWLDERLGLGIWATTWMMNNSDVSNRNLQETDNTGSHGENSQRPALSSAFQVPSTILSTRVYASTTTNDATNNPSTQEISIPISDESDTAQRELETIREFLRTTKHPSQLSDEEFTRIVKKSHKYFYRANDLWRKQASGYHQKVIFENRDRAYLLSATHDKLGHKRYYATRRLLLDRFWWPTLEKDLKWYLNTCHECQLRNMTKIHIPPTISYPAPLFAKVYIDTMYMPSSHGYNYIIHAACSLSGFEEGRMLRRETQRTIGDFIFEELVCRWSSIVEIVTDNGTPFIAALEYLAEKYNIRHIRISAYNSQANGVIERPHLTLREAIVKACDGDIKRWPTVFPHCLWANRVTVKKSTGYSPFYMAHGVEPILPFDILHATYLAPKFDRPLTTPELIAIRAQQLERRDDDLALIRDRVIKSRYTSIDQFTKEHKNQIRNQDFKPGTLVLIRNKRAEQLGGKTLPRYYGPMVVVSRRGEGSYTLAELDGAVSKTRYAPFRLVQYYPRDPVAIPVTSITDDDNIPEQVVFGDRVDRHLAEED